MKRIQEYKKQFQVTPETTLKDLKSSYRNLMKEWHPDKFNGDEVKLAEAELVSKDIIEAYHFLVSVAAETKEANLEEYNETTSTSGIDDFSFKKQILTISFLDGSEYEYFGVQEKIFAKLCNSTTQYRFCKRHVFTEYQYRQTKKRADAE